jgi:hypothetical protein
MANALIRLDAAQAGSLLARYGGTRQRHESTEMTEPVDDPQTRLPKVVRVGEQWFLRTADGSVGPLASSADVERYLALLDVVAAARGEVRGLRA